MDPVIKLLTFVRHWQPPFFVLTSWEGSAILSTVLRSYPRSCDRFGRTGINWTLTETVFHFIAQVLINQKTTSHGGGVRQSLAHRIEYSNVKKILVSTRLRFIFFIDLFRTDRKSCRNMQKTKQTNKKTAVNRLDCWIGVFTFCNMGGVPRALVRHFTHVGEARVTKIMTKHLFRFIITMAL